MRNTKAKNTINAGFATTGDFAGGVVEHVGRGFGEDAVTLRIGVGAGLRL